VLKPLLQQFFRFASAGAVATLVQYMVLIWLVEALEVYAVRAAFFGYVAGIIAGYLLNYRYTFNSRQKHRRAFSGFLAVAVVGLGLNMLIMATAIERFGLHYFISQVLATLVVLIWNFCGNRFWVFRDPR